MLSFFILNACNDDVQDLPNKVIDNISFGSMLDDRDGNEYNTIKIGDQEWIVENLRYRLPLGSAVGCYTYGEAAISSNSALVNKKLFVDSVNIAKSNGQIVDPPGLPAMQRPTVIISLYINILTPLQLIELLDAHPPVVAVLQRIYGNLLSYGMIEVAKENFIKAENENDNYSESYGLLYTYHAAKLAVPKGWRLPTDDDWKELEKSLGITDMDINKLEAWRGKVSDRFVNGNGVGFDVKYGGGKLYGSLMYGTPFLNKEVNGYFWTSSEVHTNDSTTLGISRNFIKGNPGIWRGTANKFAAYSVRCVR